MGREIKFSLVYRDMWQSAGKYVPTVDQLLEVAPAIIDMGCFAGLKPMVAGLSRLTCCLARTPIVRYARGHSRLTMRVSKPVCWNVASTAYA